MSEGAYPDLGQKAQSARDTVVNNASSAYNSVANHPVTQNITSGPAAQAVYDEKDKTANEFRNVLDSRRVPDQTTATGQPLTHYHSLFYNILSWQNPRVSAISYASLVAFIFFTRYVPLLKYVFKTLYIVLGTTAAAEVAGRVVLDKGISSHLRPRKYYTINREIIDPVVDDFEQLLNFFVIEFQRVVFAENLYATLAAFVSALSAYLLAKIVPTWGLALIGISIVYFAPLIYIKNKAVIDGHLSNAGDVIQQQTSQIRDLAAQHTSHVTEIAKNTASEYSAKAQEIIGSAKAKTASPSAPNPANLNPYKEEPERNITKDDLPEVPFKSEHLSQLPVQKEEDFPVAPTSELPSHSHETITEPVLIPDTAATVPENDVPEALRAQEVDGVTAEALAS